MASPGNGRTERLSAADAALLSEQVAGLTRASLPLPSGLRALGEELPAGRLGRALEALAEAIERGVSLDEAMAARRGALPAPLRGLVRAGERTGRTGEVLGRYAGYARIGSEVRRGLWLSLSYPLVSFLFAGALILFVLVVLVAGFEQIYADFGIPLPAFTLFLIEISQTLRSSGVAILEGLAALGGLFLLVLLLSGPAGRRIMLSHLPLLGPIWRWASLAEFCHLLGLLLESDIPLVEAVPMTGEGVPDAAVRHVARSMADDLAGGQALSRAIARRPFFPPGLGRIVAWAEVHRCLPAALHMLGEMFEARAREQTQFVSTVCTVMTVATVPFGVGAVLVAIMIPLFILLQKLSG